MGEEWHTLIKKLKNLRIQRTEVVTELASVDHEIAVTLDAATKGKQELIRGGDNPVTMISSQTVRDSVGEPLFKGDIVETITKGKYFEWTAKILDIKEEIVTFEYLKCKKSSWRKPTNLLKLPN